MRAVAVADGVAAVGAGARLGEIYDALDEHGLTIAAGCGPTVGIAGLALGGGLGILGRRHGLTSDQLVAAEVVLADGRVVECDEERHDDLFWVLRGAGGGQLGVVTKFATAVPAPATQACEWCGRGRAPARSSTPGRRGLPPPRTSSPASLLITAKGGAGEPPVVTVFGAMAGTEADTVGLLGELVVRTGAEPSSTSLGHGSYRAIKRDLAEGDAADDELGHPFSKSEFLPARAARRRDRGARRAPRRGPARRRDAPARLHAVGRRVQPRRRGRDRLRAPGRALPCSSTRSSPTPARPRLPAPGCGGRGRSHARGAPAAPTRTSPTPSSRTGRARTTRPTSSASCASRRPTTLTGSSASSSPCRARFRSWAMLGSNTPGGARSVGEWPRGGRG